jgi:hypothetical protein
VSPSAKPGVHHFRDGYEKRCVTDHSLGAFVRGGGRNSEDILKATMATKLGQENPAKTEDICELYHVHNKSKKCETAKKARGGTSQGFRGCDHQQPAHTKDRLDTQMRMGGARRCWKNGVAQLAEMRETLAPACHRLATRAAETTQ